MYELKIQNKDLCWEEEQRIIEITKNKNITELKFNQVGFALNYEASTNIQAEITSPSGKKFNEIFESSKNLKCLENVGKYKITPNECYFFYEKEFEYTTFQSETVNLIPEKYLISGFLYLNSTKFSKNYPNISNLLPKSIAKNNLLKIESNSEDSSENADIQFKFIKNENNLLSFQYKHYVKSFTRNKIIAQTSHKINYDNTLQNFTQAISFIENLLFYPPSLEVTVTENCVQKDTDFEIKSGLMIVALINYRF